MNMDFPPQVVEGNIRAEVDRVNMPFVRMVLLGIFAGMFIAGGAAASSVAMHAISNVGLARLLGGVVFPVGLMMIVFIGGELFTGDCLLILGFIDKRYKVTAMIRVLIVVYISNLIGAMVIALLYRSAVSTITLTDFLERIQSRLRWGRLICPSGRHSVRELCATYLCVLRYLWQRQPRISQARYGLYSFR